MRTADRSSGSLLTQNNRVSVPQWAALMLILAATLVCYWQVWSFEFVSYDDSDYVSKNPFVQQGLTLESFRWAFTQSHASNWHPLTWISHMIDWETYGNRAGGHHFTNVLLHCANTALLYLLLRTITGASWKSLGVAGLFALHPLHVESVAWVAERKDVLSTFFGFFSLLFYGLYAGCNRSDRRRAFAFYAAALLFFAFSLMSKPMLVTLPFVLLLLDFWPLRRMEQKAGEGSHKTVWWRLGREKIPFLCLSLLSCFVTLRVQSGKTIQTLSDLSLAERLANLVVAYAGYLQKTIWPSELAFFYPLLGGPPAQQTVVALAVLLGISIVVCRLRNDRPEILVGWLWYLGTLVPVIGFVHVGEQTMADRYTYIPLVGFFIAIVWSAGSLLQARWLPARFHRILPSTVSVSLFALLFVVSYRQAGHWRDSKTMLERALAVTEQNFLAHNNYGVVLAEAGQYEAAIAHYRRATEIKPHYARAFGNLGAALTMTGRIPEAIEALEHALSLRPNDAETHYNLAVTLARLKAYDRTILHCRKALELDPGYLTAHFDLALALSLNGEQLQALEHLRCYLQVFPNDMQAQTLLGQIEQMAAK